MLFYIIFFFVIFPFSFALHLSAKYLAIPTMTMMKPYIILKAKTKRNKREREQKLVAKLTKTIE